MKNFTWHDVAEKEGYYACTGWSVDDILAKAVDLGLEISEEEALEFLQKNANRIVNSMVEQGWISIDILMSEDFRGA